MRSLFGRSIVFCALSGLLLSACSQAPQDAGAPPAAGVETPEQSVDAEVPVVARDVDQSAGMACVMSGTISVMGITEEVEDCMSTDGAMPEADFRAACTNLAGAMGGSARIDYVDSCPTPAQGTCRNFAGSGLDAYYYKRRADDVATLPRSCSALGGTWASAN